MTDETFRNIEEAEAVSIATKNIRSTPSARKSMLSHLTRQDADVWEACAAAHIQSLTAELERLQESIRRVAESIRWDAQSENGPAVVKAMMVCAQQIEAVLNKETP